MDPLTPRPLTVAALLATALLTAPAPAHAEVGLSGHIKSFLFQQVGHDWELDRAGARLQLAVRGGLESFLSFYGAVDFELDSRLFAADQPLRRGAGLDVYPVEMVLALTRGPVDIRIGQQFIFWGRTTWVNPTDVITPWSYPDMASEIEDYRIAPFAARVGWYIVGELLLDAVWAPVFRPTRIGDALPEQMGGLPVVEGAPRLPERHAKNGEVGLRLSHSISSWAMDWAIAAYKGFEKVPVMVITPRLPGGQPPPDALVLTRRYDPLWMIGGDIAKAWGSAVFKAEAALKLTEDWAGDDAGVRNSRVEAVGGADYVVSESLDFGVQLIGTWLLSYERKAEMARLSALSGVRPQFVEHRAAYQVSLRANFTIIDELGGQLTVLYSPTYNDVFALGFLWWEIADSLRAYAGGVAFGGADGSTPFGRLGPASRLFAEIKYSF